MNQSTRLLYLLFICVSFIEITSSKSGEICGAIVSGQYGVKWPTTSTKTSSRPLCLNGDQELAYRECLHGEWDSEPDCFSIQNETPPECPDGFEEIGDFCYTLTPKTAYPPICPFGNLLPFFEYFNVTADVISDAVWMPVRRDISNRLGFLQWEELSCFYKMTYDSSVAYTDGIEGKNCVVVYGGGRIKKAVSCDEQHRGMCVYRKLTKTLCNFDENCWQSDYSSQNACFCLDTNLKEEVAAELVKPYQNRLYHLLTDEVCSIGLRRSNASFVWNGSNQKISYTFWSPEAIFDEDHIYGAFSPTGWILTTEPQQCFLVEKRNSPHKLALNLTYNAEKNFFNLEISDPKATIFCFSDADSSSLVFRYPPIIASNTHYTISALEDSSGNYWCEGFNGYDSRVVQTEKLFIKNKNFEFVAIFELKYSRHNFNPLSPDVVVYLEDIFLDRFRTSVKDFKPRIMKIVDIWEKKNLVWVNIHFSSNAEVKSSQLGQQLRELKQHIRQTLYHDDLCLHSIYSSDYCFSETTNSLLWPQTPIGEVARPGEFCFTVRGRLATRSCDGDFVDGARWSADAGKCKFLYPSWFTRELLKLHRSEAVTPQNVSAFLKYPAHFFGALDVYLLREVMSKAYCTEDVDVNSLVKNINSVLKVDKGKLIESQVTARSTDLFLYLVYLIVMKRGVDPAEVFDVKDNFVFIQNFSANISGVMIEEYRSKRNIRILEGNWSLSRIKKERYVISAIWLSPELKASISDDTKITFTVYLNDGFFGESTVSANTATHVFGVYIGNNLSETALPEPLNLYEKIDSADKMKRTCSFWSYDVDRRGFWFRDGSHTYDSEYHFCQFWRHTSNLAVVASKNEFVESNVTSNLADLIENNYLTSHRVDMLVNISAKYEEFVPMDVFLFGKVLEVVNNTETDLEALTKSVGNLHKTDRLILSQSQIEKQATDNILSYIDDIVNNINITSETFYQSEDFTLIVSDLRKENFGGVIVLKTNETLELQILRGFPTLDNITSFGNIDSGFVISPQLKTQMLDDPHIFVTIFFSDKLFNTNSANHKYVSTIYGVTLRQSGNFSGPISIFHNISEVEDYVTDCSYWSFKETDETSSFWQVDDKAKNLRALAQCDFWHTTHFALLLLDKELYAADAVILEWITYVNTSISFFGLFGIVLTAVLFKKWRKNRGNQILFNFAIAIALQIVAFYGVVALDTTSMLNCTLLGSLLHYSIIAQFCWMFVIAVLQFRRFVQVFATSPSFLLLKTCLFGWGLPLVPVTLSLIIDKDNYAASLFGFCYPSGLGLYLGIWAPILIIIALNLCIFVYIMYNVVQRKIEPSPPCKSEGKYRWRLFVLLFFTLGMTWTFGFLAGFRFGVIFVYLFCLTATLQGFVLFLYFIVLNSKTRYMYRRAVKNYCWGKIK